MRGWRIGDNLDDGRRFAASAERNKDPILAVLRRVLPGKGLILEIGSGTGQHVAHFAKALPQLTWQPSDLDADLRQSVARWIEHEGLSSVLAPVAFDVQATPWPVEHAAAIVAINVIHVSPWTAALALIEGAARILPQGGVLFLYGPYRRDGRHTAPSNERFDAELRAFDPQWGVRDVEELAEAAGRAGFALAEIVEMPANNLSLVFRFEAGPT